MSLKTKAKKRIKKFNNFVLCLSLFYVGVGLSSLLWRIKDLLGSSEEKAWKENCEKTEQIEQMEKMW